MSRRSGFLAFAFALLALPGAAGDSRTQLWPEGQAFFNLGSRVRLHLLADAWYAPASWTADGTTSDSEAEAGAHLDFTLKPIARPSLRRRNWERERYVWARVGYDYLWTPGDPASRATRTGGSWR